MMDPMVQGQMKDWAMILSMWAVFGTAFYIIATSVRRKQRNAMQQHVLDKFASAKDFADFVQSPAGQQYVMSFADTASSPRSSILNSVRVGVVLLFAGLGCAFTNFGSAGLIFLRFGVILMFLGIGFLVSAAMAFWLARRIPAELKE